MNFLCKGHIVIKSSLETFKKTLKSLRNYTNKTVLLAEDLEMNKESLDLLKENQASFIKLDWEIKDDVKNSSIIDNANIVIIFGDEQDEDLINDSKMILYIEFFEENYPEVDYIV